MLNKQKNLSYVNNRVICSPSSSGRGGWIALTVRNGCLVFCSTLLSVTVWATSSCQTLTLLSGTSIHFTRAAIQSCNSLLGETGWHHIPTQRNKEGPVHLLCALTATRWHLWLGWSRWELWHGRHPPIQHFINTSGEKTKTNNTNTNLGYDDLFAQYFHGVMYICGLLFDQNHFSKCSLPKQLQILKVIHSLQVKHTCNYSKASTLTGQPSLM